MSGVLLLAAAPMLVAGPVDAGNFGVEAGVLRTAILLDAGSLALLVPGPMGAVHTGVGFFCADPGIKGFDRALGNGCELV